MDSIRSPAPAYFGSELARETAGSPYEPHEPLAAAAFCPQPEPSGAAQEDFLRTGHYTVVTATRHTDLTHQAADKDGEATFCVQGVAAFAAGTSELEKAMPTDQQYMIPELGGAAYQLGSDGDVYNLVVREAKPDDVSAEQLATHYGQLLPDPLAGAPEAADKQKEPPAPSHCLVCDMQMGTHPALDVFTNTTHQTSTTYAIKLRQVTGHRANFAYHSEVICESCASLLNVVDSFEARLREIKARLEDTRAEVQAKFSRTCVRYDAQAAEEPEQAVPEEQTAAAVQQAEKRAARLNTRKKRPQTEDTSRVKKKAAKDESFKVKIGPQDTEEVSRRRSSTRTVERPRTGAESDEDDPEVADSAGGLHEQADDSAQTADEEEREPRRVRMLNRCPGCHMVQDNVHAFRAHLAAHSNISADIVSDHMTVKTNERIIYGCSRCRVTFSSYRDQQRHVRARHPRFSRCPVCLTQVEETPGLLECHLATHRAPSRCYFCPLDASSLEQLCRHTERQHPLALRSLYCELCRAFVDETAMAQHVKTEHALVPELSVQCRQCGQVVKRAALSGHLRVHEASFRCQFCSRAFPNNASLVVHERSHTGERPFSCGHCGKAYISKTTLEAHLASFHRVNAHACDECDRTYATAARLKKHQLSHGETKPFVCQVCHKGFSMETHLNVHVRAVHLGETPHECHVCHKRFPYKSSLKDHLHVHTGDKSHCCHVCGKRFSTAKILRSHSFTHRAEKPYRCDVRQCGASFSRKDLLARHRLSSHGIAPEVVYSRLRGRPSQHESGHSAGPSSAPQQEALSSTQQQGSGPQQQAHGPPPQTVQYVVYHSTRPAQQPAVYSS